MSAPEAPDGDPVRDDGEGDAGAGDPAGSRAVPQRDALDKSEVVIAVAEHLRSAGMHVEVAWDRPLGIDIEATGSRHLIIQAAPEEPSAEAQADAFYLAVGQLVGHASDTRASYALALPDNEECRSLTDHLPPVARSALRLGVFFVGLDGEIPTVEEIRLA